MFLLLFSIVIVLVVTFYAKDHFVHGAIPKDLRRLPQEIPKDKPVLWIQLSDFSGNPENLKLAADTLMNKVTKVSYPKESKHIAILSIILRRVL